MVKALPIQRLMSLSESEKMQLEQEYHLHYTTFEKVTHELLELMEKKENAATLLQEKMEQTVSIDTIHQELNYIYTLDQSIDHCRNRYESARLQVDESKILLTDKSIQVKKYEKLNEKNIRRWKEDNRKKDRMKMDEAANQKFINY